MKTRCYELYGANYFGESADGSEELFERWLKWWGVGENDPLPWTDGEEHPGGIDPGMAALLAEDRRNSTA